MMGVEFHYAALWDEIVARASCCGGVVAVDVWRLWRGGRCSQEHSAFDSRDGRRGGRLLAPTEAGVLRGVLCRDARVWWNQSGGTAPALRADVQLAALVGH